MEEKQPWERDSAESDPWERDTSEPNALTDSALSFGRGLVKGGAATAGIIGDLPGYITEGADWAGQKMGLPGIPPEIKKGMKDVRPGGMPSSGDIEHGIEGVFGEFQKPRTTPGKYAQTVGEFIPGAMIGPGGIPAKIASGVTGGLASEAAGEYTEGSWYEPIARAIGGLFGFAAPRMAARAVTPLPVGAERQAAIDTLTQEGINAETAGQRTGRDALRYSESILGDAPGAGGGASASREAVGEQFTGALLRRAGIAANHATPDVIDGAFHRIGADLDGLAARNATRQDPRFLQDLRAALDEYNSTVQQGSRRAIVEEVYDDFVDRLVNRNVNISGDEYQHFRSRLARLQRGAFNDPEYSYALGQYVEALDDVMRRGMQAAGSPDLGMWELARRQYRNLIPLAAASAGGGEQAASGIISPGRMREVLTNSQRGQRDYARGRGDYADLVRAGNVVLTPLPNSGTGQRELVRTVTTGLGSLAGNVLSPGAEGVGLGGAAGAVAPSLAGRALMSHPAQGYLGNQVAAEAAQNLPTAGQGVPAVAGSARAEQDKSPEQTLESLGAKRARDGKFYIPDPQRPGKYLRIEQ